MHFTATSSDRTTGRAIVAAIDAAIEADDGARYREFLGKYMPTMEDAFNPSNDLRHRLGISNIGHNCERAIWFGYRWVQKARFPGRLLRLFNRGHLEEARFLAALELVGIVNIGQPGTFYVGHGFMPSDRGQTKLSLYKGLYGSAVDAVLTGVPGYNVPMLGEFKTHGEKSFLSLVKKGVRESKPMHYVQMNQYAGYLSLSYSFYMAVNKNTDDLYIEIIPFDKDNFSAYKMRAERLLFGGKPPAKTARGPSWYTCTGCQFRSLCWDNDTASIRKSCRTCAHVGCTENDGWHCTLPGGSQLTVAQQVLGCQAYVRVSL